jgi:nucleoside-diphosphate-sugar epimerase
MENRIYDRRITGKVLITGASGFIGSVLAKKLKIIGHEIYGISRKERNNAHGINWYKGDLADIEFVEATIKEIQPDPTRLYKSFRKPRFGISRVQTCKVYI